jgi:hypothetical protein
MQTVPLSESAPVTLDGSGNGTASLGPSSHGEVWTAATVSVQVSPPVTNEASCLIYLGHTATQENFVDGTFSGSSGDSTDKAAFPIRLGTMIFAVWSGGDPGAVAYLNVNGTRDIP